MDIRLTVETILALAEDIERSAGDYYRRAAQQTADGECRELFRTLAALEEVHEEFFSGLRKAPPSPVPAQPEAGGTEGAQRPALALSAQVIQEQIADAFRNSRTSEQVLRHAVDFEKQTVLLFRSLRDSLGGAIPPGPIERIIREEMEHVVMLSTALGTSSAQA